MLDLADNFSQKLLIEIKKPSQYPNIENMIVDKLKERQISKSKVILQSFDFDCVKKLSAMNLDYELGLLISKKKYWHKLPNFKKLPKLLIMLILIIKLFRRNLCNLLMRKS